MLPIGDCVPTQTSSRSACRCTVAFSGSIGGMREIRRLVKRLDDLAALAKSASTLPSLRALRHRPVERVAVKLGELRAVDLAGGAGVPFGLEQRERLLGAPEAVGDHGDGVGELDHLQHAAPAFDRRLVDALELAAGHRASMIAA